MNSNLVKVRLENRAYPGALVAVVQSKSPVTPPKNFVHTLRRNGFKVRVKHFRFAALPTSRMFFLTHITNENRKDFTIHTNGGKTLVEITNQKGVTHVGEANCVFGDTYFRRLGVYLAATRALKAAKQAKLATAGNAETP